MLNREPGARTLPTFITLLVMGLLLMTFDVRSEGGGVTGTLRTGAQTIVAPLQKAAAFVVNPVVNMIDSLSNVATLREQNIALQQELAEFEAALIAVDDDLARLEFYEQLYDLETSGTDIGRTVAQVIGRPDASKALIIDKGTSNGIAVGQPVIDTSGYVVGTVQRVTAGTAIIVPITVGPDAVAVIVGEQAGVVVPQVATNEMRLEIFDAREPVFELDRVVTSSASVRFPAGYPVGEVTADAAPSVGALSTGVRPFVNVDALRVVVVLAWPPDPVTAVSEPESEETSTTSTIGSGSTTTSTTVGGG
ncbi:MAG TPA: rod shape-determining protein MreC [Acidimicrobiia bacterium]